MSDIHDKSEVIKTFHLFLYSIEINLFKHVSLRPRDGFIQPIFYKGFDCFSL